MEGRKDGGMEGWKDGRRERMEGKGRKERGRVMWEGNGGWFDWICLILDTPRVFGSVMSDMNSVGIIYIRLSDFMSVNHFHLVISFLHSFISSLPPSP